MPKSTLEQSIQRIANQFVDELIGIIRGMTVDELAGLSADKPAAKSAAEPAPRRRGRPRKVVAEVEVAPAPKAEEKPAEDAKPAKATKVAKAEPKPKPKKKKRVWPKCSEPGCDKNVYMPSGDKKLCYKHHLAAGGQPTPLSKVNKKREAEAAAKTKDAPKADKKPVTKVRKGAK